MLSSLTLNTLCSDFTIFFASIQSLMLDFIFIGKGPQIIFHDEMKYYLRAFIDKYKI